MMDALLLAGWLLAHDGVNDEWYGNLHAPNGFPCCNMDDCKNVPARIRPDGKWEVWIGKDAFEKTNTPFTGDAPDAWVVVPDKAILKGHSNPTGEAVACWYRRDVLCFVPPPEV